ncbi:MAG: hypothetical protein ACRD0P_36565 [Stackebrandtia sp.]
MRKLNTRRCCPSYALRGLHMPTDCDETPVDYVWLDRALVVTLDHERWAYTHHPRQSGLTCVEPVVRWDGIGVMDAIGATTRWLLATDLETASAEFDALVLGLTTDQTCACRWEDYAGPYGRLVRHLTPTCESVFARRQKESVA